MSDNVEEVQAIRDLFDEYFEEWVDNDLELILDETFEEWMIGVNTDDDTLLIHAKLNDAEKFGEDLDSFLEYQVLGMKFMDSLGLKPDTGYKMDSLLKILSDYILIYSFAEL